MNTTPTPAVEHSNQVRLVGRVAAEPELVLLPSGDEIVTARLVVQRPRRPAGLGRRRSVDTINCTAWTPTQRRKLIIWEAGDTVEVTGALRRRFWRAPTGAGQSTFEIEVESASRLVRRPPPSPKPPVRRATAKQRPGVPSSDRHLVVVGGELSHQ